MGGWVVLRVHFCWGMMGNPDWSKHEKSLLRCEILRKTAAIANCTHLFKNRKQGRNKLTHGEGKLAKQPASGRKKKC